MVASIPCRWDAHEAWTLELWSRYTLTVRRGAMPLHLCPPEMLDCQEVELQAEGARSRRDREKEESQDLFRQHGLMP